MGWIDDRLVMENDKNDTGKSFPPRMAHDLSLETAKIMFHGTNQELTSEQVAHKLAGYCLEAWKSFPVQGRDD